MNVAQEGAGRDQQSHNARTYEESVIERDMLCLHIKRVLPEGAASSKWLSTYEEGISRWSRVFKVPVEVKQQGLCK